MNNTTIILVISILSLANCYKMTVFNGVSVNLTCILPSGEQADRLIFVKGGLRHNSIKKTLHISDLSSGNSHCSNEYKVLSIKETSKYDEGTYKCVFYHKGNETYRHKIELSVMPKIEVSAKDDDEKHRRYFIINVTRPITDSFPKISTIAGGVNLGDVMNTDKYAEHYETRRVTASTIYDDCTRNVTFDVSYMGLSRKYVASIDSYTAKKYVPTVMITGNIPRSKSNCNTISKKTRYYNMAWI
ncbi:immunoglobulin-like domain protein [Finch poxvirus]|uniref:Immunoglobulin-like domain protein n=1 Tax=Condorpox virus TaxID=3049970 RepID=A0AAT9UNJ0_9POXV|nr:immunoglobulin-like domain protein [Finch poxvirus]UOX39143.1 immunoglobulin-like domain protein [Finch poxvirus]